MVSQSLVIGGVAVGTTKDILVSVQQALLGSPASPVPKPCATTCQLDDLGYVTQTLHAPSPPP